MNSPAVPPSQHVDQVILVVEGDHHVLRARRRYPARSWCAAWPGACSGPAGRDPDRNPDFRPRRKHHPAVEVDDRDPSAPSTASRSAIESSSLVILCVPITGSPPSSRRAASAPRRCGLPRCLVVRRHVPGQTDRQFAQRALEDVGPVVVHVHHAPATDSTRPPRCPVRSGTVGLRQVPGGVSAINAAPPDH